MLTEAGSTGLAATQARVSQLQTMLNGPRATASTSSTDFATSLSSAVADSGGNDLGQAAVDLSKTYIGVPYLWGGTDPSKGLDCSGLVQLVYGKLGIDLPRVSQQQQNSGVEVPYSQARPGDLVFFGEPAHHVGIYIGDGKMIHAPHSGSTVRIQDVYQTPSHVRRVTPTLSARSASATVPASSDGVSGPYASLFTSIGRQYGVDPALLSAVAKAESSYNAKAVSSAGALGLMQLMPGTARSLGVNPLNPTQAVTGAARLLSGYLDKYDGRIDLTLAAYNAGPGAVQRYGGVPPYSETRHYIQRVTSAWKDLR
jgi:cell wall-associated NlpC family hydrolase